MITAEEITHLGHFGKPHGINGALNLYTDFDPEEINEENFTRLVAEIDGINVPFFLTEIRTKRPGNYIVRLNDIESEDDARLLTNLDVYVLNVDNIIPHIEDSDGMYAADLVGYTIISATDGGVAVGSITDVDVSTDNALFIVERNGSGDTMYIPIADEMIADINPDTQTIVMQLPDGLLSIN